MTYVNNCTKTHKVPPPKKGFPLLNAKQRIKRLLNLRITAARALGLFCLLHLIVWVLLPLLMRPQILIDSAEGFAWGLQWQLGYYKHPFLAPWITALFARFFGNIDFSIYLAGQLSIVICFWAIWRLAQKILSPWQALLAVMLLETNFYYNVIALQFNPNVLMLPLWALAALAFYNAITKNKICFWVLTGICLGLAFNTKYEAPLLVASMLSFMLWNKQSWRLFKSAGPYIAGLICTLLFLPNMIWLMYHNLLAVHYAQSNLITNYTSSFIWAHIQPIVRFSISQLGNILPTLACLLLFYFYSPSRLKTHSISQSNWKFILSMSLGPLFFALLFSLLTASELKGYWSYPFYSFLGILLMASLRFKVTRKNMYAFLIGICLFQVLTLVVFAIYLRLSNSYQNKFPYKMLAQDITQAWHRNYHSPLPNILGTRSTMSYITAYSSDHPTPYFGLNSKDSPWTNDTKINQQGGAIVWDEGNIPAPLLKRFPHLSPTTQITYTKRSRTYRVNIAFIQPEK